MKTRDYKRAILGSEKKIYINENFHRQEDLNRLVEHLITPPQQVSTPIILLSGEEGMGRSYLLQAAAFIAAQKASFLKVVTIDLDGFEVDRPLVMYVKYQLAKYDREEKPGIFASLLELLTSQLQIPSGIFGVILFSVILDLDYSSSEIEELRKKLEGISGREFDEKKALEILLFLISKEGSLLLHIPDFLQLSQISRSRLLELSQKISGLKLAFSTPIGETYAERVKENNFFKVEITPYQEEEIRGIIEKKLNTNQILSKTVIKAIWAVSKGIPYWMAKSIDYLKQNLNLLQEKELASLAKKMREALNAPVQHQVIEFGKIGKKELETLFHDFLKMAALCGESFPAKLICEVLKLTESERDFLINYLDNQLIQGKEEPWFYKHEIPHPGFPAKVATYSFMDSSLTYLLLKGITKKNRVVMSENLLELFHKGMPTHSQTLTYLHYRLWANLPDEPKQKSRLKIQLESWINFDEAKDQTTLFINELAQGKKNPETLWITIQETKDYWPPFRRLSLLEAYSQSRIPDLQKTDFFVTICEAYNSCRNYEKVIEFGLKALEIVEKDTKAEPPFQTLLGLAYKELKKYAEAEVHLKRSLSISEKIFGPQQPNTAVSISNLAGLYEKQGRFDNAEREYTRALEIIEKFLGPEHAFATNLQNNFGWLYEQQNRFDKAEPLYLKVLRTREKTRGPHHIDTATALNNVAKVYEHQQRFDEAIPLLERVLKILEHTRGLDHANTVSIRKKLSNLRR